MSPTTQPAEAHAPTTALHAPAPATGSCDPRWGDLARTALSLRAYPSAHALLAGLPAEACRIGRFERVLLSHVDGSRWTPTVWHEYARGTSDPLAHPFRSRPLSLRPGSVETETVRRRLSHAVLDAAVDDRACRPLVEISQSSSYIVAPVVAAGRTIALLHADHGTAARVTTADHDLLRHFAVIAGFAFEAAHLADRLEAERRRISDAIFRAHAAMAQSPMPTLRLVHEAAAARPTPEVAETTRPWGLSARELSVLDRIAAGHSNREVAELLFVSENTVKSHIKHIFRKLGVGTRAEVVALAWKRANGDQRRAS